VEPLEVKARFIELRAKGNSFDKIAGELGLAKKTLVTWSKEYRAEIEAAKALELEALLEKHFLLKEQQIEQFGRIVRDLDQEIAKRNLSELPTSKLLELRLKYQTTLNEELPEPAFLTEAEIAEETQIDQLLSRLTGLEGEEK
jgi:transposase